MKRRVLAVALAAVAECLPGIEGMEFSRWRAMELDNPCLQDAPRD